MSYTEFHKGKLRVLTRNNKETFDYIEKNNLQDVIKECGWCDEIDFDVVSENSQYIILHKDDVYHEDDCEHMLCEYIEHETQEGGGDYYANVKRIGKDDYEFTLIFYNGSTCEEEILSEKISKLEKEPYDKDFEMVKISPRESYMILDCFQYVLMHMNQEKLDYLYCNYSREEITKLGQKFGDMNLKNGW